MLSEKLVIFALDPKLDRVIVTLVLTSAPKFLWLEVHFDKLFWFWYETEIVPENSYSYIWPFLEIHNLKYSFSIPNLHISRATAIACSQKSPGVECSRKRKDIANNSGDGTGPPISQEDRKWNITTQLIVTDWTNAIDSAPVLFRIFQYYKWPDIIMKKSMKRKYKSP